MATTNVSTVALIGVGMVARSHLASIADLSDRIRLRGVLRRDAGRAASFAAEARDACGHDVAVYDDLVALCADDGLDWVILLTPPNARADIVDALIAAGKPILMEKPVERDLAAATALVEACEAADLPLGIVFQHRTRAASRAVMDLIDNGALGDLAIAEAVVPWWRDQAYYDEPGRGTFARDGGGVLISQAIHTLDLMLRLTGPVAEVQAMTHTTSLHKMESEDYVTAACRFANGAAGSIIASTASYPGEAESITLHFTKAAVRLAAGEARISWRDGRTEVRGEPAATGGGADPMAFTHHWHRDVIADFADALATDRAPMVTGREALQVHALIEAIVTSSDTKSACPVAAPAQADLQ